MPNIHLTTFIAAPLERVFDLSRSIDLHKKSMAQSGEQAVAGTTMGLIGKGETVTWKAKHLMKTRIMKIRISEMNRPVSFVDEMIEGDFKSFRHQHHFKQIDNGIFMIDIVDFESPYGKIGSFLNSIYLTKYLRTLLENRNEFIRNFAESNKWKDLLNK
ncbi:MAG: cell division protein [Chitinophagaceae bacterium]|nr:MAG: cell division protein [Chitinophagaceae bacterium]